MVKSSTNTKSCTGDKKTLDNSKGIGQFIELSGPLSTPPSNTGYFIYIKASDGKLYYRENGVDTALN